MTSQQWLSSRTGKINGSPGERFKSGAASRQWHAVRVLLTGSFFFVVVIFFSSPAGCSFKTYRWDRGVKPGILIAVKAVITSFPFGRNWNCSVSFIWGVGPVPASIFRTSRCCETGIKFCCSVSYVFLRRTFTGYLPNTEIVHCRIILIIIFSVDYFETAVSIIVY